MRTIGETTIHPGREAADVSTIRVGTLPPPKQEPTGDAAIDDEDAET